MPKYSDSIGLNRVNNLAARAARILEHFLDVFPQNYNAINADFTFRRQRETAGENL